MRKMNLINATHLNLIADIYPGFCYLQPRCPLWMGCDCPSHLSL